MTEGPAEAPGDDERPTKAVSAPRREARRAVDASSPLHQRADIAERADAAASLRDHDAVHRDETAQRRDEAARQDDSVTIDHHVALFARLRQREEEIVGALEFAKTHGADQAPFTIEVLTAVLGRVIGDIAAVRDELGRSRDDLHGGQHERASSAADRQSAEQDRKGAADDRARADHDRGAGADEAEQHQLDEATRRPAGDDPSPPT